MQKRLNEVVKTNYHNTVKSYFIDLLMKGYLLDIGEMRYYVNFEDGKKEFDVDAMTAALLGFDTIVPRIYLFLGHLWSEKEDKVFTIEELAKTLRIREDIIESCLEFLKITGVIKFRFCKDKTVILKDFKVNVPN